MSAREPRTYRRSLKPIDLVSFHAKVKESDLWICAEKNLEKAARDLIFECRQHIENYIRFRPEFGTSLSPLEEDPFAPPIVRDMIRAAKQVNVGPMASVAGAIAQYVGEGLLQVAGQVIVENGGDIFLKTVRPAIVSILAGSSPLSGKLGLKIPKDRMPLGVCSSSATVGHSLSLGNADTCCLLACSAALADGAATALGNRMREKNDLEGAAAWADRIPGILGGVVILGDLLSAWGDIELIDL